MNYKIVFTKDVEKAIKKWKRSNKPLFDKLKKVLNSIMETPREGIGHPEAMKGGNSRITVEKPLIVYESPGVYTENILKIYGMV